MECNIMQIILLAISNLNLSDIIMRIKWVKYVII